MLFLILLKHIKVAGKNERLFYTGNYKYRKELNKYDIRGRDFKNYGCKIRRKAYNIDNPVQA